MEVVVDLHRREWGRLEEGPGLRDVGGDRDGDVAWERMEMMPRLV